MTIIDNLSQAYMDIRHHTRSESNTGRYLSAHLAQRQWHRPLLAQPGSWRDAIRWARRSSRSSASSLMAIRRLLAARHLWQRGWSDSLWPAYIAPGPWRRRWRWGGGTARRCYRAVVRTPGGLRHGINAPRSPRHSYGWEHGGAHWPRPSSRPHSTAARRSSGVAAPASPSPTVYRTLGSAEISVQHGPYGFRFGQLMFCRGVATDLLLGVMNHRQCGQQTPKIPQKCEKQRI